MYTNRAHCRALRLMFALRKEQAYFINLNGICLQLRPKGVQGASGKPPASGMIRQLCRNQFPVGGRVGFDILWVSCQLRCPKVSKGRAESPLVRPQAHPPCRGIDAPTPAREWDLPSHGALTLFFRWRKKSVQKKASGTATPEAARPAARRGLRPAGALRAVLGLGSLCSPAGTKALIAHFAGGTRNVARNEVG